MSRTIFIKNWVLQAPIGLYEQEKGVTQRLRVSIDITEADRGPAAYVEDVIDYGALKARLGTLITAHHREFLETLADEIANVCVQEKYALSATVTLEKLDIFADCESCGVTLTRKRP